MDRALVPRLEHLEHLGHLGHLERLEHLEHLGRLEHLEHLERLGRLEQQEQQGEHRALEVLVQAAGQDRLLAGHQLVLNQAAASRYYLRSPIQMQPQPVQSA